MIFLQDNKPSPYATEKASEPVDLHINKISVARTVDGKFTIQGKLSCGNDQIHDLISTDNRQRDLNFRHYQWINKTKIVI